MMRTPLLKWVLGTVLAATALVGCGDNKNQIAKGRKYAQMGNYVEAHKAFDEALANDANDYNALWGKADTFRREGALDQQAALLEKVIGDETLRKTYGGVVVPALEENYRKQAERTMAEGEKAEAFLRKAIKLKKTSDANATLATLLNQRAKGQMAKKDYKAALASFEAALKLRMPRKQRKRIKAQLGVVQFMAFKKEFEPRWQTVKPKLIAANQYDEKTDTIFVEADVEVVGDSKAETYAADAERQGLAGVTTALNELTWTVADKDRPEGASVSYDAAVVAIVEKGFAKKKKRRDPDVFHFRISLPRDAVIEKAGEVDRGEFNKPKPPAAPGSAPASGAAAPTSAAPASAK